MRKFSRLMPDSPVEHSLASERWFNTALEFVFFRVFFGLLIIHEHIQRYLPRATSYIVACVSANQKWMCVVRLFERVGADGDSLTNEFECSLLMLTKSVVPISPELIFEAVSVVHECGESCKFTEDETTCTVERETIVENKQLLSYKHDFSNDFYVLNIFCINQ